MSGAWCWGSIHNSNVPFAPIKRIVTEKASQCACTHVGIVLSFICGELFVLFTILLTHFDLPHERQNVQPLFLFLICSSDLSWIVSLPQCNCWIYNSNHYLSELRPKFILDICDTNWTLLELLAPLESGPLTWPRCSVIYPCSLVCFVFFVSGCNSSIAPPSSFLTFATPTVSLQIYSDETFATPNSTRGHSCSEFQKPDKPAITAAWVQIWIPKVTNWFPKNGHLRHQLSFCKSTVPSTFGALEVANLVGADINSNSVQLCGRIVLLNVYAGIISKNGHIIGLTWLLLWMLIYTSRLGGNEATPFLWV